MTFISDTGQRRGVWSEEEMRDIFPDEESVLPVDQKRRMGRHGLAEALRCEVNARNVVRAAGLSHELTRGSQPGVIYAPETSTHGNFIDASYRRICAEPDWSRRLKKAHTAKRMARPTGKMEEVRAWRELDAASSSDALLMNIFCYPRVLRPRLCSLLGVAAGCWPEFGYKPRISLLHGLRDATEIDMKLDGLLVEAKLTEADFQIAPLRKLQRYVDFAAVFDLDLLACGPRGVEGYQLIRGVLAALAEGSCYAVLCDARRTDLHDAWFRVVRAVRSYELQARMRMITWQEITMTLPAPLRSFLAEKYGITG
jgi:hypothetical protein